jgi:hypothetical protein
LKDYFAKVFTYREGKLYWRISTNRRIRAGDEAGSDAGAAGYSEVTVDGRRYQCHRVIYTLHTGENPKYVDHIDGDPTNNRIENLRAATNQENSFNACIPKNNTSGIKGVAWHKASNKWRAYITTKLGPKYLGYFTDIETAAAAITKARELYHGEFARHI